MIHRVTRDHIQYRIDKELPPVATIDSGDTVLFETFDARTGTIRTDADLLDRPHPDGSNPATGHPLKCAAPNPETACAFTSKPSIRLTAAFSP